MPNKLSFHDRHLRFVVAAVMMAIIGLMTVFPQIGFIKFGIVEITILTIPVVIGAVACGPWYGLLLGVMFGFASFSQCFGFSPFGAMLLSIQPVFAFILCVIPRALMGWLSGLVYLAVKKVDKGSFRLISFVTAAFSGALLNTVLFVSFLLVFYGNTDYIQSFGSSVWEVILFLTGTNALIEMLVCTLLGTAIAKPIELVIGKTMRANKSNTPS